MSYYQMGAFAPAESNLHQRMLRLRGEIAREQAHCRSLSAAGQAQAEHIASLRIWEMEAQLTALLDIQGD